MRSMISIPGSLSFVMSRAPAKKSAGDARCASQDPSTRDESHKISTQIRIRKRSSYVEHNKTLLKGEVESFIETACYKCIIVIY